MEKPPSIDGSLPPELPTDSTPVKPLAGVDRTAATGTWAALSTILPELKLMVGLVSSAVLIAALYFGRDILMPLCVAFLLGFILDPLVARLKRWGLPRPAAVIVVMVCLIAVIGLAGFFLGQQVSALSAEVPTYQTNMRLKLRAVSERLRAPGMFDGALKTFDAVKTEVETSAVDGSATMPRKGVQASPTRV